MNTDRYLEKYFLDTVNRADELNKLPLNHLTREAYFAYFDTGNRINFEKLYFENRERLTVFGLICSFFGDYQAEMYIDKLFEIIESILNEKTWQLPAHNNAYNYDNDIYAIDLFAAETAESLAEILYRIGKKEKIRNKIRYTELCDVFFEVYKKRITDVYLKSNPCDWWENAAMNWAAVCSGNVAMSAYYSNMIRKNISDDEYDSIMDRCTNSMKIYLSSMGDDGACEEGTDYYKYGMEYFLGFYELLREEKVKGAEKKLEEIGDFRKVAEFLQKVYLGNGKSINFSDCNIESKFKTGMVSFLSAIYDTVRMPNDYCKDNYLMFDEEKMDYLGGRECHRWLGARNEYLWVKKYGACLKAQKDNSVVIFEDSMWYIKKWDSSVLYVKGGHNDESHNHNDIGSFGFLLNGEEVFLELGAGEYTADYFSDKRYEYLCTSSNGHNVPSINGQLQKPGRDYYASDFNAFEDGVGIEFGRAYGMEKEAVKRLIKTHVNGGFEICDSIIASEVTENLVTSIEPTINNTEVFIRCGQSNVGIDFGKNIKPYKILCEKEEYTGHLGERKTVYVIKARYAVKNGVCEPKIYVNILKPLC